jgi:hypothetical protein
MHDLDRWEYIYKETHGFEARDSGLEWTKILNKKLDLII